MFSTERSMYYSLFLVAQQVSRVSTLQSTSPCLDLPICYKLYSGNHVIYTVRRKRLEENGIQTKSFFFFILIDGQNVSSSPFPKPSWRKKPSEVMPAGPWNGLNRDNQHGSILTPSQLVPTGSHSSKPGLLGWPGRQMEMIWAHPVWPEFDPLGKIWKRKEGEKRRQTDSLKNYAYWKLDI